MIDGTLVLRTLCRGGSTCLGEGDVSAQASQVRGHMLSLGGPGEQPSQDGKWGSLMSACREVRGWVCTGKQASIVRVSNENLSVLDFI